MGWYVAGVAKLRDVCRGSCIYSLAFDVIQHLFLTTGQLSLILPLPCPWHDKYEVSSLVFTDIQSGGAWWFPAHRLSWIPCAISSACLVLHLLQAPFPMLAHLLLMGLIRKMSDSMAKQGCWNSTWESESMHLPTR